MNADNVEEIGAELLALAADPANKQMVLNLAGVEFLFSTALGKLVALEKKLQAQRGTLRLCELRPVVSVHDVGEMVVAVHDAGRP